MNSKTATVQVQAVTVTMPPGEYVVGDPCYSVPDDRWMEWLQAADYETAGDVLLADLDGLPVLGLHTRWGDGTYTGSDRNEYPVDSGLLGLVPLQLLTEKELGELGDEMVVLRSSYPVRCSWGSDGLVQLGTIVIATDDDLED